MPAVNYYQLLMFIQIKTSLSFSIHPRVIGDVPL
jgi:hypothetical protein